MCQFSTHAIIGHQPSPKENIFSEIIVCLQIFSTNKNIIQRAAKNVPASNQSSKLIDFKQVHTGQKYCSWRCWKNKKFEIMLMRRARAYSSFSSQVILIYLYPFLSQLLFCGQKSPKNH